MNKGEAMLKNCLFFTTDMIGWEYIVFQVSSHDGTNNFGMHLKKRKAIPKTAYLAPKSATLVFLSQKMACQAVERPPTEDLKDSKVTSGFGDDIIPSS